jgi:L-iditol 2-dehydrogenase
MELEPSPSSLPDSCTFDQASLAEPLSVVIHASRRCALAPSQTVLAYGVGAIGLLACALAKHTGASRVCAVDINPVRLEFAKKHGFADAIYCLPSPTPTPPLPTFSEEQIKRSKDAAAATLAAFDSKHGFDVVFECTGAESAIQMSIFVSNLFGFRLTQYSSLQQTATTGGRVMLIGMGTRVALLPLSTAALREVDILGSFRYADTYPQALALLASPSSELRTMASKLVTHRFGLSDTKKAFEILAKGVDEKGGLVLKVMVGPGVQ